MKRLFLRIVLSIVCIAAGVMTSQAATNAQYCVNPVYSVNPVKPNVMIVQDMTGSMLFTAYMPNAPYSVSHSYFGLFDTGKCYQYSTGNAQFETVASCDCSDKIGSSTCISGNILNWATMSRLDVAKKALTGGKRTSATSDVLISEGQSVGAYTQMLSGDARSCVFSVNGSRQLTIKNGVATDCSCHYEDDPPPCPTVNCNCRWVMSGKKKKWVCDQCPNCGQHQVCTGVSCTDDCNLGNSVISNANIRVKVDDVNDIGGLVESFADRVNFEYMIFNASSNLGTMIAGKGVTEANLINAINGETAGGNTPTGPALKAAYTWYTQGTDYDTSTYQKNTDFVDKGNTSNDRDPYYDGTGGNVLSVPCRKSYILLISDGEWNSGSDPVPVAYKLHTEDLRDDTGLPGLQTVTTYSVYLFGNSTAGANSMKTVALFGGFDNYSTSDRWPYTFTSTPSNSLDVTWPRTNCTPSGTWNSGPKECPEWDKSPSPHTGLPYNYFEANQGDELVVAITSALNDMVRKASSGTAASVLGSSEGSGANLIQSFYYPKRTYANGDITWMGAMQNLWFYIDPTLGSSTIREDSTDAGVLDFTGDCIIEYEFDPTAYKTVAHKYTPNSDGSKGAEGTGACSPSPVDIDAVNPLWEAGAMLWKRNLSTNPRTIFTSIDGTTKTPFDTTHADSLYTYMDPPGTSTSDQIAGATNIINYVTGNHVSGFRNRSVQMTYKGTEDTQVWKLGDIISSTPRMKSSIPVNSYHLGSPDGYLDMTYRAYINSSNYKNRGMVYVGANDGMLHAFEMGSLSYDDLSSGQIAKLNTVDSIDPGTERWAFVPKNVLPYMKYLTDPEYCHMYFVDAPVTLVDASVVASTASPVCDGKTNCKQSDSWKTILIGGMGSGGACRGMSQACSGGGTECTKTPISDVGFSSYFAIDVTDPINPKFLWEFSSDALGYSTTGPAIVRIGDPDDTIGHWYAVFANGPTGTVETSYNQLKAMSDQPLKMFVFDLYSGPGVSNANVKTITTSISNAFGGSLNNSTIDVDKGKPGTGSPRYSDDVFYLGYTKKDSILGTWTKGGVIRVMTNGNTDPNYWTWSKVIDNIGPVTGSVSKLQDRKNSNLWIYFGTGRYWYRTNEVDSASDQQALYGIKEPCYNFDNTMRSGCASLIVGSDLSDKSGNVTPSTTAVSGPGWFINLEVPASTYKAERAIAGPVALNNGVVVFTTIEPSADICAMGGTTFVWVTWYNNGTAPPASALTGQVMTQVSSGRIALKSLGSASSDTGHTGADGGRTISLGAGGIAGGSGGSLIIGPRPLQKILHIRER